MRSIPVLVAEAVRPEWLQRLRLQSWALMLP